MMDWNTQKSIELYGLENWGQPYFTVNNKGHIEIQPDSNDFNQLDLHSLVEDLIERGIRLPILVRFPDIVRSRIELINNCFNKSINEYGYQGKYQGVYPIKVNQQRHMVQEIVDFGRPHNLGLECGSKPELLVALAHMDTPDALIVCNGFKDSEYIETALLSQKLGKNTIVVVDRVAELDMILEATKKLEITPRIGLRTKLNTKGGGKWIESSGARSKFGLTPSEIVRCVQRLKEENLLDSLCMLHFHIGSQIPSILAVKDAVREGARVYTELYAMGARLNYIDVGGGLGVDYDGTGHGASSTNYDEQEYANDVVSIIQSLCDEKNVPHPNIVSESGRSIVAHSSILIFDVLGLNEVEVKEFNSSVSEQDSRLVQDLYEIYQSVNAENINESYNDLKEKKRDTQQLFSYGVLSLEQRAKADDLYWATLTKINRLSKDLEEDEDIYWQTQKTLSDTYFCNFSIFQSLPDSWAVGQRFPVMPIHRLNTQPNRQATLVDLTCDSDGKIDSFIDTETGENQKYLEVHELNENEPYYIAVFLTGAYQETLGDLHNLFGDTDAVHITMTKNGYTIDQMVEGDSVTNVLSYVQYHQSELIERIRQASEKGIAENRLTRAEAKTLMRHYQEGLSGYTYLE